MFAISLTYVCSLEDDPFYQHGLAEYDITEFIPTKTAQELSFLLEK